MTYKRINPNGLSFLDAIGMRITTFEETFSKLFDGCKLSSLNLINVFFGLYGTKFVNIPVFLVVRKTGIMTTLICNWAIVGSRPDIYITISAFTVVAGSILGGYESLDDDALGYFLIICNNFATSIYSVVCSMYNADKRVTSFEITFFFALLGLPFSTAIALYTGEIWQLYDVYQSGDTELIAMIFLSGIMGICITITAATAVSLSGPFATNISGVFKDVLQTWIGFFFFKVKVMTPAVATGILLSFVGASFYIYGNLQKRNQASIRAKLTAKDDKKK
jgi:hypothetical protein